MLEGKNYNNVNIVLPLFPGFVDTCAKWLEEAPLTRANMLSLELMLKVTRENCCEGWNEKKWSELEY